MYLIEGSDIWCVLLNQQNRFVKSRILGIRQHSVNKYLQVQSCKSMTTAVRCANAAEFIRTSRNASANIQYKYKSQGKAFELLSFVS